MAFEVNNVYTTVNAQDCKLHVYGYFTNDLESLKQTVQNGKSNLKTIYAELEGICSEKFERRFMSPYGVFALFYPTDKEENIIRY